MYFPAGFEDIERSEAIRIRLLGGFRVSVGPRSIEGEAWRLRKAASLIKLLALAPAPPPVQGTGDGTTSGPIRRDDGLQQPAPDPPRRPQGYWAQEGQRYLVSEDGSLLFCPKTTLGRR